MRRIEKILLRSMQTLILAGSFFLLSLSGAPERSPFPVHLAGLQAIASAESSTDWDGVRGSAKFIKDITDNLTTIIQTWEDAGLFKIQSTYTNQNEASRTMNIRIQPDCNVTVNGPVAERTYVFCVEGWNLSSGKKAVEFFINQSGTVNEGVLMRLKPRIMDTPDTSVRENAVIECQVDGPPGERSMICTLNSPDGSYEVSPSSLPAIQHLRLKAEVKTTKLYVTLAARLTGGDLCPGGDQKDFWAIAYIAGMSSPYYSTARRGGYESAISTPPGYCGLIDTDAGFFNTEANPDATDSTKYLYRTSATNQDGYPSLSDVDTLFGSMASGKISADSLNALDSSPISWARDSTAPSPF